MKKKNKKNQIRMRLSKILLCILAILLCAAPALHADETVPADETWDVNYPVTETLYVEGIANLRTGASAQFIYVQNGGTLNMYSGTIGLGCFINVGSGAAGMTVYGTDFAVSNGTIEPDGNWTPDSSLGRGILTGCYEDESSIYLWIFSNTAINLQPPPSSEEIQIDIKPGGNPNNINLKSNGVVPVAVLTTDDFDAGNIDPTTVTFAGAAPVRWKLEDVDDDGDVDMLYHFRTQKLSLDENSTEATLTGTITSTITSTMTSETTDGKEIRGTDKVCIVPGKKK